MLLLLSIYPMVWFSGFALYNQKSERTDSPTHHTSYTQKQSEWLRSFSELFPRMQKSTPQAYAQGVLRSDPKKTPCSEKQSVLIAIAGAGGYRYYVLVISWLVKEYSTEASK